jgi:long-chain fatty acid transport protein
MRGSFGALLALGVSTFVVTAGQPARGAGPLLFQHGARGAAQVGALTARADQPLAVTYNPAAIARLEGLQFQAGMDFTAPRDDYKSASGSFAQDHLITETPALYLTYHLPDDYYPWAFGIGLDSRSWYLADWLPALFPGRFLTSRQEMTLWSVHPVIAYGLSERWSAGAGLRYYLGELEEGNSRVLAVPGSTQPIHQVEVARIASADVDGFSLDLGLHYASEAWGWGLVLDSGGEIEGSGDVRYEASDVPTDPELRDNLDRLLARGSTRQSFELPWEVRTGFWVAPYPELRLELDFASMGWSVVESTSISYSPNPFTGSADGSRETRRRDWDDTLSIRLGLEGDLGDHWMLYGGVAYEPSPVPSSTVEPGFARGDAMVYGLGMGYTIRGISFDLGYSFYAYDDRGVSGQELAIPGRGGRYESHDQAFAFSVSWR